MRIYGTQHMMYNKWRFGKWGGDTGGWMHAGKVKKVVCERKGGIVSGHSASLYVTVVTTAGLKRTLWRPREQHCPTAAQGCPNMPVSSLSLPLLRYLSISLDIWCVFISLSTALYFGFCFKPPHPVTLFSLSCLLLLLSHCALPHSLAVPFSLSVCFYFSWDGIIKANCCKT